jgi:molybdopterin-binding protein
LAGGTYNDRIMVTLTPRRDLPAFLVLRCSCNLAGEEAAVRLSARNQLKGKVIEVTKGQTTAHVRVDIGGHVIMAAITNEAVDDLALAPGKEAYVVVKASDVMIATD